MYMCVCMRVCVCMCAEVYEVLTKFSVYTNFQTAVRSRLEDSSVSSPETILGKCILQTSVEVFGISSTKNKYWYDQNNVGIQELLVKKRSTHRVFLLSSAIFVLKRKLRSLPYIVTSSASFERSRTSGAPTSAGKPQLYENTRDTRGFQNNEAVRVGAY